jgi:hypothetical protein
MRVAYCTSALMRYACRRNVSWFVFEAPSARDHRLIPASMELEADALPQMGSRQLVSPRTRPRNAFSVAKGSVFTVAGPMSSSRTKYRGSLDRCFNP